MFFRKVSSEEEQQFRQWARDNYKPFSDISGVWHPYTQDECVKMNLENASLVPDKKDEPEHNHFGEMHLPKTCPACRAIKVNIE